MRTRNVPQGKVEFIQYHQPYMESGEYRIKVEQTIQTDGKIDRKTFSREITFVVCGERFSPLAPTDIHAVFPPANTIGDHSNVLPHITLKRSTLPWERFPDSGKVDNNLTWLVLLLFRESDFAKESDKPQLQSLSLRELQATSTAKYPAIDLEPGQHKEERVNIIDVKWKYLQPLLPTKADLAFLAHTRQAKDKEGNSEGEQLATILSNRLPEPNGISTAYLVSVEGRYQDGDADSFDFDNDAGDDDLIRLVTLASWSFGCIDPDQSFTQLLMKLNGQPSSPRLPSSNNPTANNLLAQSYIPLRHALREGSKTVSWYRGPLISGSQPDTFELPVRAADELMRYDSSTGLFDSSYAAAWQLGRMLTLQNQRLAIELFNWKRENAQNLKQLEQQIINPPLRSNQQVQQEMTSPPEAIADWFKKLELLQGIPFNYLMPDERLLPAESIRFFWVDSVWVDCLQDGAFSVGRVTPSDVKQDGKIGSSRALRSGDRTITGCILRSQVVSGWPDLLVDAYDTVFEGIEFIAPDEATPLVRLRMEKLAPDVLICLFKGEVKTVDIHQQPEGMHFGLDAPSDGSDKFTKNLRYISGEGSENLIIQDVPWHDRTEGIVNISAMVDQMKKLLPLSEGSEFTSAQFGLQMIEGVQKVRFIYNPQ